MCWIGRRRNIGRRRWLFIRDAWHPQGAPLHFPSFTKDVVVPLAGTRSLYTSSPPPLTQRLRRKSKLQPLPFDKLLELGVELGSVLHGDH